MVNFENNLNIKNIKINENYTIFMKYFVSHEGGGVVKLLNILHKIEYLEKNNTVWFANFEQI